MFCISFVEYSIPVYNGTKIIKIDQERPQWESKDTVYFVDKACDFKYGMRLVFANGRYKKHSENKWTWLTGSGFRFPSTEIYGFFW